MWKYSTVMQIIVVVLGVEFLSVTTVTSYTDFAYSVKMTLRMVRYRCSHYNPTQQSTGITFFTTFGNPCCT